MNCCTRRAHVVRRTSRPCGEDLGIPDIANAQIAAAPRGVSACVANRRKAPCSAEEPALREATPGLGLACHFSETLPLPVIVARSGPPQFGLLGLISIVIAVSRGSS